MNTIFRSIWNAATQTWVAASEHTKGRGKGRSTAGLAAAALVIATVVQPAMGATSPSTRTLDGPAIAGHVYSHSRGSGTAADSTDFRGHGTSAAADTTPGPVSAPVPDENGGVTGKDQVPDFDTFGQPLLLAANNGVKLGQDAEAHGDDGVAVGASAKANESHATAVGGYSQAAENASAFGHSATASGTNSTALGSGAQATAAGSVAIGSGSVANRDNTVSVGAAGNERVIANVRDGVLATDASTVGQLTRSADSFAEALGGGARYDPDTGALIMPSYNLSDGTFSNVGDALASVDRRTTTNHQAITDLSTSIANGTIGLVQQDPSTGVITVGSQTGGSVVNLTNSQGEARQIQGVAAGAITTDSTFAVNGGQIHAVGNSISTALGGGSQVLFDGTVSVPVYSVGGQQVQGVQGAVDALDSRVTNVEGQVSNVTQQINNGEIGLVRQAADGTVTVAADKAGSSVDVAGTAGTRTVTGVTDGTIAAGSTDAVTGNQLHETNTRVSGLEQSVGQQIGQIANANAYFKADGANDSSDRANATAGSKGVAAGANASAQGTNSVAIGASSSATANNSVAIGANSVADRANTVSVGAQGNERIIANVADGVQPTDAVNRRQLDYSYGQLGTRIDQVTGLIGDVASKAYSGIAGATALSMLPDVDPGKTISVGVAGASYQGYGAGAIGISARINQNIKLRAGAGVAASGTTVGGGIAYQW